MDGLQSKAILAGIFFGIWPLLMNRSGLNGNIGSFAFTCVVLLCVLPFSATKLGQIGDSHWGFAIAAGIAGAIGLLLFNDVIAKASVQDIGLFFVVMIVAQVVIPAVYQVIMTGGASFQKIIGFVLAGFSILLLLSKDSF